MEVSKQFLEEIMGAVGEYWSDSEADSELSVRSEEREEFRYYGPDVDRDVDSSEPQTSEETDGDQGAAAAHVQPPSTESRCAALEQLLERKPGHRVFSDTISRALYKLSELGRHEEAQVLLKFGADPNYTGVLHTYSPLHLAVENGDAKMVEILMKNGASPSIKCANTAETPLVMACSRGHLECVRTLLDHGADANDEDPEDYLRNYTPLHVAVERGDAKIVEILMKNGASPVTCEGTDHCPLVTACLKGDLECVRTMLDHGADANNEDPEGRTPLMVLLEEQKSLDVLELLLQRGADPNLLSTQSVNVEATLFYPVQDSLDDGAEEQPESCDYAVKAMRLLLRHGFRLHCCGPESTESLLELSLSNFTQLFPLAALLLERDEPFEPDHACWPRFEAVQEALHTALQGRSEAEARPLVDKANTLLDLPVVRPPHLRFTLSPVQSQEGAGADRGHRGAEWAVDTVPASLQSLCRAFVRRSLLPWPLEPKIQTLPIPDLIKDLLMPLKQD